jgi:putative ABC transport system substrate-binding protein
VKRREFITLIGGAAAWPLAARAQPGERVRRVGVFSPSAENDPIELRAMNEFRLKLAALGWTEGRNVRFDYRWGAGDTERYRAFATELAALGPDVIWATQGVVLGALQAATRTVPIVFTLTVDPVGAGRVASLARPGGNMTGFTIFEYGTSAKWLELLKELSPGVRRVAVIRDPDAPGGIGQFAAILAVASSFGVDVSPIDGREAGEIEHAVSEFARLPNGGLIVTTSTAVYFHRELIAALASRHRLPAVYSNRRYVAVGGLISYAAAVAPDQFRGAAGYVDRILRGEKPADLPVQAPTKYELVLNLKTARELGINVPASILLRADEVIE